MRTVYSEMTRTTTTTTTATARELFEGHEAVSSVTARVREFKFTSSLRGSKRNETCSGTQFWPFFYLRYNCRCAVVTAA